MSTTDPKHASLWSTLAKVFFTFLAVCLLLVNMSASSGWIVVALVAHAAWFIKMTWTDKHG
ncbi:MAG: hypothetical protein HS117_25460 [Verrucomicrobiaceae bacterium]|jgi:uncharacterized membrane protein YjjB (DUF3815 family)|nr:hypothetical protein [Verrucomicrobiaceae bacterium]